MLADLPEEQRPVAERALQGGLPAVRQAVNEQNARLKAEGKPEVPAAGLLSMAEGLLPTLRVAEWLDRADAAKADIEELDLRDLRSVVAAGEDPMVARDESTRAVATELKAALVTKQESELALWFEDIDAAIGVGRVIRALKLSSQPPKAGVRFPTELAGKLATATTANLTADAMPDRWVAVLEAAAFSPDSHADPADGEAGSGQRRAAGNRQASRPPAAADRRAVRDRGQPRRVRAEAACARHARSTRRSRQKPPARSTSRQARRSADPRSPRRPRRDPGRRTRREPCRRRAPPTRPPPEPPSTEASPRPTKHPPQTRAPPTNHPPPTNR